MKGPHGPCVPVNFGNGDTVWVTDEAWGRQLITALTAAVNQLEAVNQPGVAGGDQPTADQPAADQPAGDDPGSRAEDTVVLDSVADDPEHDQAERTAGTDKAGTAMVVAGAR
jgi:hypothetical protein